MNSDIDWIFAFIEIAIGIYSLLKGMIDFIYSGLPKHSNGNTPILNRIKLFEYFHAAFVLDVIYAYFFSAPTYSRSYIHCDILRF